MSIRLNASRDDILKVAAHGNAAALEFLRAFATRAHWIDDLRDADNLPEGGRHLAGDIAQRESEWLLTIAGNPFFLANRAALVPAMLLALNAWVDSESAKCVAGGGLREADRVLQVTRDIVKGQWHEVVWLVAWLTGGWQHLRATSREFRAYDFESEKVGERESGNSRPAHFPTCSPAKGDNGTLRT